VALDPVGCDAGDDERLARTVAGLDRRVPVIVDRLADLDLLGPDELFQPLPDPDGRRLPRIRIEDLDRIVEAQILK
jgi:hypothetical protein